MESEILFFYQLDNHKLYIIMKGSWSQGVDLKANSITKLSPAQNQRSRERKHAAVIFNILSSGLRRRLATRGGYIQLSKGFCSFKVPKYRSAERVLETLSSLCEGDSGEMTGVGYCLLNDWVIALLLCLHPSNLFFSCGSERETRATRFFRR